jgi:hypothetical protein
VLGFFGDACLFDTALDRDVAGDNGNVIGAAAAYWRIFLAAVRDRPLAYAGKFVRQMAYGASVAWPPYGLDPAIPVSTDDVPHVSDIMTRHGRASQLIDLQGGPIRIGLLSDFPSVSAYLFRALSTVFVIAVIFWTVTAVRRRPGFVTRAGIVIVMWAASIATAAAAHTLDVWRYLIPAVPMVGLMLSLFAVELAETIACLWARTAVAGLEPRVTERLKNSETIRHLEGRPANELENRRPSQSAPGPDWENDHERQSGA